MSTFSITVEAPALAEAINHLADAIKGTYAVQNYEKSLKAVEAHTEQVMPMNPPIAPAAETASSAPAVNREIKGQTVSPLTAPNSVPTAPVQKTYTLDELSIASADLIDSGKMQQIMAIIQKYGVPAINLLKPEQYESYAADIRAIGGKI